MEYFDGIGFEKVTNNDVETLTIIMKRAFDEDSKRHLGEDTGGPTGYDNGDFIRKWYFRRDVDAYKVLKDDHVIGGANVLLMVIMKIF